MAAPNNPTVAVCACSSSCESPGSSLPCCQSFLEICQAPPTPSLAVPVPLQAPQAPPQAQPPAFPQAKPRAAPAATSNLPACTPSDCGQAISWDGTPSGTPACLCSPLCVYWAGESGILPCCDKLQQVCLDPFRSPTPNTPPPTPTLLFHQSRLPSASLREADGSLENQNGGTQSGMPGQQTLTASSLPAVSPACSLGMSAWAEQATCAKKRYAIKSGQCQKVCSSVDPQAGIKYYPKTQAGKAACAAALKLC